MSVLHTSITKKISFLLYQVYHLGCSSWLRKIDSGSLGKFLGYVHPSGEIHISEDNDGQWVSCPGQDNDNSECIVGAVSNVFFGGDEDDHDGPYNNILLGACHAEG
jgi:hypothetical protein